MNQHQILKIER